MPLARYNGIVQDDEGRAVGGCQIEVRRMQSGQPLQTVYSDRDGENSLGSTFPNEDDGTFGFHVIGGVYRIKASKDGFERILEWVAIGTNSERDFGGVGTPSGGWEDSPTAYDIRDIVSHSVVGSDVYAFISNHVANEGNEPSFDGTAPESDDHWTVLGLIEAPGAPGADGDPGSSDVVGTSASSVAIGTGSKTFTVVESDRGWGVGARLRVSSDANGANFMEGVVTSYSGVTLQVLVDRVGGAGTHADWTINLAGEPGEDGADGSDGADGDDGAPGANGADGITPARRWNFDSSPTDADPGNGDLRLNHATPSSVTEIYVDNQDALGNAATAWLDSLGGGTTTNHKGYITLFKIANPAIYAQYVLTAAAVDGSGYRKLTVSHVESAGTFTAADPIAFDFSRTGNKGADGLGSGDVTTSGSVTTGRLARYADGTGDLLEDAGVATSTDGTLASNSDAKIPTEKAVKTYADTKAPIASPTFTGTVTLAADPTLALQAATKQYVDGLLANMGKRARVRAATTANITIATALNNGDSLDGVTLATDDLVLVKNQTAPEENGVYVVGVSPARATEFDTYNEHAGSLIAVQEGSTNADTLWLCTSNVGGTLGTTAIAFSKMVIAGEVLAANNGSDFQSAATTFGNLKQPATTSATGVTELAVASEYRSRASGNLALTPEEVYAAMAEVALTDAASIAWDFDTGFDFSVTLGGNRAMANGSNLEVGKKGRLRIVQDGTGSRTLSWGTDYEFAGGSAPTLSTAASAQDVVYYDIIAAGRVLISPIQKAIA